jgi:CheY-like chemotaxis protein
MAVNTGGVASLAPRILVVDDEPGIRVALRRYFQRRGWIVDEADNGARALQLLMATPAGVDYDVVICDLTMPVFSGVELHDALAASRPELLDRVIFSTGYILSAPRREFLARWGRPILEKPFDLSTLGRVVERMLESRVTAGAR